MYTVWLSAFALAGNIYVHLIGLPPGYQQLGEPWNERRNVPGDAQEYELPPIDVVTYGAHNYNPVQGGRGILGRYIKAGFKVQF